MEEAYLDLQSKQMKQAGGVGPMDSDGDVGRGHPEKRAPQMDMVEEKLS